MSDSQIENQGIKILFRTSILVILKQKFFFERTENPNFTNSLSEFEHSKSITPSNFSFSEKNPQQKKSNLNLDGESKKK